MKKIIFLLVFVLSWVMASCQTSIDVYKSVIGKWNTVTKNWDYSDFIYSDITFTLKGNILTAGDRAGSRYDLTGKGTTDESTDEVKVLFFKRCIDEKGRICSIGFMKLIKENVHVMSIIYNDTIFRYYIKDSDSELSGF